MNYHVYIFPTRLIHVEEKSMFIDGKEQKCLIIPTLTNQMIKSKHGEWMLMFRLSECSPNEKQITHNAQLMYTDKKALEQCRRSGVYFRTKKLGFVYEHSPKEEKRMGESEAASSAQFSGFIMLEDIPDDGISINKLEGTRVLNRVRLKEYTFGKSKRGSTYSGYIALDNIPKEVIQTSPKSKKKYIGVLMCRLPQPDYNMNTHKLVVILRNGAEVEIGRFKELGKNGNQMARPDAPKYSSTTVNPQPSSYEESKHDTTVTPRPPRSIDGIKF